MAEPKILNDPLYQLLRGGQVDDFNQKRAAGQACDFRDSDLRGLDLRGLNANGLDMSGCYFRQTDLRGIDFRQANLEGSSIHQAKISGAYFPDALDPSEIQLSYHHGTRMRYVKVKK